MTNVFSRLLSAWQMVVKRSLTHWRLLSAVVVGVVLASAIMAGTVIYFDTLRELALQNALSQHSDRDLDILVKTERGPTTPAEYVKVFNVFTREVNARTGWMLKDRIRAGKSATFFLTVPGNEAAAGSDNARGYFAFLPRLDQHTTVKTGRSPRDEALSRPGELLEIEAVVPEEAAQLFGVGVGDHLSVVPHWEDAIPYVDVVISGIFSKNDPGEDIWHIDEGVLQAATRSNFRTVPFFVSEKAYIEVIGAALPDLDSTYAWLLDVDTGRLDARNALAAMQGTLLMDDRLRSSLFSYRQYTSLHDVLAEYDQRLFFTKLPMFVMLILIAVVILYYVVTTSSLLVEQQRTEIALLRSRGASPAQILVVFLLQGATISAIAAVVGPIIAVVGIGLMGFTPAFSELSGAAWLPVKISGGAYMMSALGGALSFFALMIPAVQASRVGVTRQRQQAARPSSQPIFQRYYLDVLLLIAGILLFRQLTEQGSLVATRVFGEYGVNQLLLAVPALILVAAAMVVLRLFPLALGLSSRLLSRWLPAGIVLGLWQMARNPTHYARLSLLLILMAGLGIFAASFGGTLDRSFEERVNYATGSDIRVSEVLLNNSGPSRPVEESYEAIKGVEQAAPVYRGTGFDVTKLIGESYTMLAIDGERFEEVGWTRGDFSDKPMADLLRSLKHSSPPQGVVLPDDARTLGVRVKSDRPHLSVVLTAQVKDAHDRYFTYDLGPLNSPGWSLKETSLSRFSRSRFRRILQPVPPLTLVSLALRESDTQRRLQAGSILFDEVRVRTGAEAAHVIEPFDDVEAWSMLKVTPDAVSDDLRWTELSFNGRSGSARFTWSDGPALTSRGIFHGPPVTPLPVLASEGFLTETGHTRGESIEVSAASHRIPVQIVDTVDFFPTLDPYNDIFLISDLSSLAGLANLDSALRELKPNEVWLSTDTNGVDRSRLTQTLSRDPFVGRRVLDREALLARSQVDPLVKAGWRALLFLAFAAVLILSCLGFLVHAYVSFTSRGPQFALLRTVGFSMKQLTTLVWLEQALVVAVGMGLGTWMGGRLGALIMPFLGYDDLGSQVLPPFVIQVNWGVLTIVYGVMVFIFAVIVLAVIWLIRRISLQRILRLGEM